MQEVDASVWLRAVRLVPKYPVVTLRARTVGGSWGHSGAAGAPRPLFLSDRRPDLVAENLLLNAHSMMICDIQERRSQLSSVQEVERKRLSWSSRPVPEYHVVALRVRTGRESFA